MRLIGQDKYDGEKICRILLHIKNVPRFIEQFSIVRILISVIHQKIDLL